MTLSARESPVESVLMKYQNVKHAFACAHNTEHLENLNSAVQDVCVNVKPYVATDVLVDIHGLCKVYDM